MAHQHLTDKERFYIEQRLAEGDSIPNIAKVLGRHKTTLYREIKRNTDPSIGFYSYLRARNIVIARKHTTVRRVKILNRLDPIATNLLSKALKERMSPEQISGLLREECQISLSHQTLYRYLWADRANGGKLYLNLRRRGKKYKPNRTTNMVIQDKVNISVRAPIEHLRQEAGHFEADTIFGLDQKSYLLTLVDIATGYTIIIKLDNKEAQTVYLAIKGVVANTLLPFKSITTDNGCEFAHHKQFTEDTSITWYFCDPYCSWQRGLNENTNGLIRDFYPKRTDFREISDTDIMAVQNLLNNRPRKRFNFLTPTQVMVKQMVSEEDSSKWPSFR